MCSFNNFLLKTVIGFFFGNQISKWRLLNKRAIFDLLFTFFSYQENDTKFLQHILFTYIHTRILLTLLTMFAFPILQKKKKKKKMRIHHVWFLFGRTQVLVLILIRAIFEQSINNKMVSKI